MLVKILATIFIPVLSFCQAIDLSKCGKQLHSQNGEDGILNEIFQILNIDNGFCVEFGAADGYYLSNTLQFRERGWDALLLDGQFENPDINLYKEWINKESILDIFAKYNVPREFELLSIDIDSNDWYIWAELGKVYKPKVLIIEFNPSYGPKEDMIIEYNPLRTWDGTSNYSGASFMAYFNLGRNLGYSLIAATHLNAIFIRNDVLADKKITFKNMNNPRAIYIGPATCAENLKSLPHKSSYEMMNLAN